MRTLQRASFTALLLATGVVSACLTPGCGSDSGSAVNASQSPENPSDNANGPTVPTAPAGCVPANTPDLPDDDFADTNCDGIDGDVKAAVFVSPIGVDTADGSIAHPLKTLTAAITLAVSASKYVIVANGTYAESVTLSKPISIYGGYDPQNWGRENVRATIAPTTGTPLTIKSVTGAVLIDHMAVSAPAGVVTTDSTAPTKLPEAGSSVAAFVANSPNVTFRHMNFTAANGANGSAPPAPVAVTTPNADALNGMGNSTNTNGYVYCSAQCTCTTPSGANVSSVFDCRTGAEGGARIVSASGIGADSGSILGRVPAPAHPGSGPLGGTAGVSGLAPSPGGPGQTGPQGAAGKSAANGVGSADADGYHPSNTGADGSVGGLGGGGGGGGAINAGDYACNGVGNYVVLGAGGGAGGDGGNGGAGGQGSGAGGASIGLLSLSSGVTLEECTITTGNGGLGADAVPGAKGQPGGPGGLGGSSTNIAGCGGGTQTVTASNGGSGGQGGTGGAGGAGGGGPSVGIFYLGGAPSTKGVSINTGAGGKGGNPAATSPDSTSGADGIAQDTYAQGAM